MNDPRRPPVNPFGNKATNLGVARMKKFAHPASAILSVSQAIDRARRTNASPAAQLQGALSPVMSQLGARVETISGSAAKMAAITRSFMPRGWTGFSEEEIQSAIALATEQGIATIWAPREAVVRSLIDAPRGKVLAVLTENQAEVLEDVTLVLGEISDDILGDWPAIMRMSVAAFEDGHVEAAQALSAALLTTIIHELKGRIMSAAREYFERLDPDQVAMRRFRLAVVLRAVATTISDADGSEESFNRHATVHHASLSQYSRENSLSALLLVSNLVREIAYYETRARAAAE
jgi:hypothetical protein